MVTLEQQALEYMRTNCNPDEGGWVQKVDSQAPGMSVEQFRRALSRLARRGLVKAVWWPGGSWVWFPERTDDWSPERSVDC